MISSRTQLLAETGIVGLTLTAKLKCADSDLPSQLTMLNTKRQQPNFGTRPLIAFARAPWVTCPAASAGSRARICILSNSTSPGAMAAIVWLTVADIMLVVQKSSISPAIRLHDPIIRSYAAPSS
jgi:hypothetical protein